MSRRLAGPVALLVIASIPASALPEAEGTGAMEAAAMAGGAVTRRSTAQCMTTCSTQLNRGARALALPPCLWRAATAAVS